MCKHVLWRSQCKRKHEYTWVSFFLSFFLSFLAYSFASFGSLLRSALPKRKEPLLGFTEAKGAFARLCRSKRSLRLALLKRKRRAKETERMKPMRINFAKAKGKLLRLFASSVRLGYAEARPRNRKKQSEGFAEAKTHNRKNEEAKMRLQRHKDEQ
uniref:Transmembrane protein n=1 Tax=Pediastrum duplex TaxID=3105 RepID=A0A2U8GIC8_PEDDU|nr:hypothetical protein [Pediastrum duplex]